MMAYPRCDNTISESLQLSQSKKRGYPTCEGVDPKTCMRCQGKLRLCDWYRTDLGWIIAKVEKK